MQGVNQILARVTQEQSYLKSIFRLKIKFGFHEKPSYTPPPPPSQLGIDNIIEKNLYFDITKKILGKINMTNIL